MSTIIRPSLSLTNVYLYRDPVDFRKSFKGLAVLVEQELGHNPFDGYLYAFTNRHRNKIKCLFWEDNGFVLYYKSLSEDKFRWPKKADEVVHLTGQQLNLTSWNPLIICATYSSFCPMRIPSRSSSS
ncbi:transposase [Endozoicomonas sp. (ex Bugula neritina AB1)]|nr:transposase [Endozoicomonas sp. (ex Bugula neritina AB1)]